MSRVSSAIRTIRMTHGFLSPSASETPVTRPLLTPHRAGAKTCTCGRDGDAGAAGRPRASRSRHLGRGGRTGCASADIRASTASAMPTRSHMRSAARRAFRSARGPGTVVRRWSISFASSLAFSQSRNERERPIVWMRFSSVKASLSPPSSADRASLSLRRRLASAPACSSENRREVLDAEPLELVGGDLLCPCHTRTGSRPRRLRKLRMSPLLLPVRWQRPLQPLQQQRLTGPPGQDRLHDVRRPRRKPQDSAHVAFDIPSAPGHRGAPAFSSTTAGSCQVINFPPYTIQQDGKRMARDGRQRP